MSEKRKDSKGRILRTGESQRPNLTYQYRFKDLQGKTRYVYAPTLNELREKEQEILRDLADGIDYAGGEITVFELVEQYLKLKQNSKVKASTMNLYQTILNRIRTEPFMLRPIKSIKPSDAKAWLVSLHKRGVKYNSLSNMLEIIAPAFEMAVNDDRIRKNPFRFRLSEVVTQDAQTREALTLEQQKQYLELALHYRRGHFYNDIVILLGTGLRVSELYGLTKSDIDFEQRCIHITKQLYWLNGRYTVSSPKSESSIRTIPMTDAVCKALRSVLDKRGNIEKEIEVDGYKEFLFISQQGTLRNSNVLERHMRLLQKQYDALYEGSAPKVTPHVLRHTFCTNMQRAGLDIKSLQYLMGHSHANITLNVYTHSSSESAAEAFWKLVPHSDSL